MPKYQGYKKLHAGFHRNITSSEVKRGYLFISKDSALREIVGGKGLELIIDGQSYGKKDIDKHGRVIPGNNFRKYIAGKSDLYIRIFDDSKIITVDTG